MYIKLSFYLIVYNIATLIRRDMTVKRILIIKLINIIKYINLLEIKIVKAAKLFLS